MPSTTKKPAETKRASVPRQADFTALFYRDWERLTHAGRYDMQRLKQLAMLLIANDGPLGPEWQDHALKGEWAGRRECHVGGDFLLVYRLTVLSKNELIVFERVGTHAQLFR